MFWSHVHNAIFKIEEDAMMVNSDQKRYHYTLNFKAKILKKWKENSGNISKTARENEVRFSYFIYIFFTKSMNLCRSELALCAHVVL